MHGERKTGSVLRAGLTGWKDAKHLTCHPSKVSACTGIKFCKNFTSSPSLLLPPMCQPCHHPAKTQQHRAPLNSLPQCCFLTVLVLPVHPGNKQHRMINLGSTGREGPQQLPDTTCPAGITLLSVEQGGQPFFCVRDLCM